MKCRILQCWLVTVVELWSIICCTCFLHNFITCCGQKLTQISPNSIKNRRYNIAPGFCKNMTCWEISTERKFDPISVWPPIFTLATLLAIMSAWFSIDWFWIEKSFTVLNLQSIFRDSKKGLALYWHRLWPPVNPFSPQKAYKNTNPYIWLIEYSLSEGVYTKNQNLCWLKFYVNARYLYIRCIWFQLPLQNLALIHNERNTNRAHNHVRVKCRSYIVPKIASTLISPEGCNSFAHNVYLSFIFAFDIIIVEAD